MIFCNTPSTNFAILKNSSSIKVALQFSSFRSSPLYACTYKSPIKPFLFKNRIRTAAQYLETSKERTQGAFAEENFLSRFGSTRLKSNFLDPSSHLLLKSINSSYFTKQ